MMDSTAPLAFACGYTDDKSGGVFSYRLNEADGTLQKVGRTPAIGATFAAIHPKGTHLYTVNRVSGGVVVAYRVNSATGELTELNRQSSEGEDPSYVSVDPAGRYVFVSNYAGGTVAMFPIEEDGKLGAATDIVDHEKAHGQLSEQDDAHPHSISPGPENKFVYAPDLGTDQIAIYRLDTERSQLQPTDPSYVDVENGAGPRHFEFHPSKQVVYVINELNSTLTVFDYDPETGQLDQIEVVSTLPEGFDDDNYCADVHVHPSGKWLYASNRGHDSIAVFEIDRESSRLIDCNHYSTQGHWPRDFAIDPSGQYLYVENRHDNSIVPFKIDRESGQLNSLEQRIDLPEPICLRFADPDATCE